MAETPPRLFVNRNVELRDIPVDVDKIFNWLSTLTGKKKIELYREALIEYAANHKADIMKLASDGTGGGGAP